MTRILTSMVLLLQPYVLLQSRASDSTTDSQQSLITWVVIAYIVLTEKLPSAHQAYNIIAVLALDGFLVIMWLATFAAVAAKRAAFVVDVDVGSCYSDGSLIDSKTCFTKRGVILFESGLAIMAAIAGLGALVW